MPVEPPTGTGELWAGPRCVVYDANGVELPENDAHAAPDIDGYLVVWVTRPAKGDKLGTTTTQACRIPRIELAKMRGHRWHIEVRLGKRSIADGADRFAGSDVEFEARANGASYALIEDEWTADHKVMFDEVTLPSLAAAVRKKMLAAAFARSYVVSYPTAYPSVPPQVGDGARMLPDYTVFPLKGAK